MLGLVDTASMFLERRISVCVVNGSGYTVSCTLNFSVTILQANVSFDIFSRGYAERSEA